MYEPRAQEPDESRREQEMAEQAEHTVRWLTEGDRAEQTLTAALGGLPNERDERVARMAAVLQATAHGLGPRAASVWAGVPEHLLQVWLAQDPAFAAAVDAAVSLARAHGPAPRSPRTPAAIRIAVLAMSRGADWDTAARAAGLKPHEFRTLWKDSPVLRALVDAARRARARKPHPSLSLSRRSRIPGRPPSPGKKFRLVRRDTP